MPKFFLLSESAMLAAAMLGLSGVAAAQHPEDTEQGGFYNRKQEGWFFYQIEPDSEPEEAESAVTDSSGDGWGESVNDEERPFTAAWLKANIDRYKNIAIDNPTVENVKAYLYLQRLILEKSSAFARVFSQVVMGDPYLDAVSTRPIATWGSNLVDARSSAARENLLHRISENAGLIYVFRANDDFSTRFSPVFKNFTGRYGFETKVVSLDSSSDPAELFSGVFHDPRAEKVLKIKVTPAVFLAGMDGKIAPVVQGLVSQDDLAKRLINAAGIIGIVSEDELAKTRAVHEEISLGDLLENKPEHRFIKKSGNLSPSEILQMLQE